MLKRVVVAVMVAMLLIMPLSFEKGEAMGMQDRTTWLWDTSKIMTDGTTILSFLEEKTVTKVYLQINTDIDMHYYNEFINEATAKGIQVYALDGAANWVSSDVALTQFMNWLRSYQEQATTARFSGIHLDVEPYLHSDWSKQQAQVVDAYQTLLTNAVSQAHTMQLSIEADIPFWFDEITYKGQFGKGLLADWVIQQVDSVTIMAYRDQAQNIIDIVQHEIAFAGQVGKSVVVGVETDASAEGQQISFYEDGERYMNEQLAIVQQHYAQQAGFKGIAIHHVDSWRALQP
ncbi:amidase [Lysinibacillus piscis]|uniref:Amidase n=1 Tax=Lysinibacillus piscis TaxID=2518931 RepID=A0ABQ5NKI1_9BACI|nr:amidase [Lysinibacillus sp. KH24]GLC88799.1 hypothetical protein LYSBPC_19260 [Lysinibacillus sp. KH24]